MRNSGNKETCKTCEYWERFSPFCGNEKSEWHNIETYSHETCPQYQKRTSKDMSAIKYEESLERISRDRLRHMHAVAVKMQKLANSSLFQCQPYRFVGSEAFVLGFLHDIGYQFSWAGNGHAKAGGAILKRQGYKFWKEVYYHGDPDTDYDSPSLWLLNYVDMTTSPKGKSCTIKERIEDMGVRYGEDSKQVKDAIKIAQMLKERGYEEDIVKI